MKTQKVIVVCGPTATGKSDYAVTLAQKTGGEVISADSRQVYKGLDLGSGKITPKEMKGVIHHMLNVASPKRTYSVAMYQKQGQKIIDRILQKGKVPIICGGTGFYIDALLGSTFPEVPPNKMLRKNLEKLPTETLVSMIQQKDTSRAQTIDTHNRVRLIRALEIIEALGKVPKQKRIQKYEVEWVYLDFPDEILKDRIHKRLLKRVRQGMIQEVQSLVTQGVSYRKLESFGLEYRYTALFLQNKLSKKQMLEELESAIWHYVKRQRTWFKKYKSL